MVKCTHLNDQEIPDSSIILENYNAQLQGCAYYFTSHGGRIRDLPSYDIVKTKPDVHDCCKSSPEAAQHIYSFGLIAAWLLLWFSYNHYE